MANAFSNAFTLGSWFLIIAPSSFNCSSREIDSNSFLRPLAFAELLTPHCNGCSNATHTCPNKISSWLIQPIPHAFPMDKIADSVKQLRQRAGAAPKARRQCGNEASKEVSPTRCQTMDDSA